MALIQDHIKNEFIGKGIKDWKVEVSNTSPFNKNKVSAKLTGPLKIEGDNTVEEITLEDHEITEVIIANCPKLKIINVGKNKITKLDITKIKTHDNSNTGNPAPCDLTSLMIAGNVDLEEVSLEYCPELEEIAASNCDKLDKFPGVDKLKKLKSLLLHEGLLNAILKSEIQAAVNAQNSSLIADKASAEQERDAAKSELGNIKTERDNLKQQLEAIKNELGVGSSATQEQIIAEIQALKLRPTTSCTHTDYDAIKAERDRLKTENDSLKNNDNNDNEDNVIEKKILAKKIDDNFKALGFKISDAKRSEFENASSAAKVQEVGSEIITNQFNKLKSEKDSSFYLSIGLGILTIGSWVILAWVLMKDTSLPKTESKEEEDY